MVDSYRKIRNSPPTVSVIGFKNSGKTSIAVGLVTKLRERGWRVMSVKHGHHHDIDTPGTDSWRLRHEGGAEKVVLSGPEGFAVMGVWGQDSEMSLQEVTSRFLPEADIVVAEGYKGSTVPKIEVWRTDAGNPLLYRPESSDGALYLAVVSDSRDLDMTIPVFDLANPNLFDCLAELVEKGLLKSKRSDYE